MGWASIQSLSLYPVRHEVRLYVLHHEVHPYQVLQGASEVMEEQADPDVLPCGHIHDARGCFCDNRTRDNKVSF